MPDTQPAPGTGWTIEGMVPRVAPNASGALVQGQEITYKTGRGVISTVFLPQSSFSVENARALVAQAALQADQVMDLKG